MFIGYTSKKTPEEALVYWMRNCGKKIFAEYEIAKDVKKYGKSVFKAEYLTSAPTDSEAQEIVDRYIDTFNTLEPAGYNKNYAGIRKMNQENANTHGFSKNRGDDGAPNVHFEAEDKQRAGGDVGQITDDVARARELFVVVTSHAVVQKKIEKR